MNTNALKHKSENQQMNIPPAMLTSPTEPSPSTKASEIDPVAPMATKPAPSAESERPGPAGSEEKDFLLGLLADGQATAIHIEPGANVAIIARSIVSALFEQKDFYGYRAPAPRTVGFLNLDSATASLLRAQFPSALEANRVKILSEASATQAPSDFASPDGRALLLASMRDEVDVAVVCHRAAPAKALHSSLDLPRLHEALFRKARAVVHLVQLAKNQPFESWLQCCSSALIVCPCSPDVGYSYAHMVRPADGTLLAAIGVEPVIENVRPRLDRTVESFVGPCVSADAVSREIARQAEEGRSLAQIGDSLGFDKSTIKRRLDRLGFKIKRGPQLRDE